MFVTTRILHLHITMKITRTCLNLETLSDRIVPSTTTAQVGQSNVVNAIYIDDGSTGTGIDITNSPLAGGGSDESAVDYVSVSSPSRTDDILIGPKRIYGFEPLIGTNPPAEDPKPVPPGPLPRYAGPGGVEQPARELSGPELVKVIQLRGAIESLSVRREAYEDALLRAYMKRVDLLKAKPIDFKAIEANRLEINGYHEEIYMLKRKINELQNAIDTIDLAAQQGYPANSFMPPPEVEDRTKIGTADGKFVDIRVVLQEMYYDAYPHEDDLFS